MRRVISVSLTFLAIVIMVACSGASSSPSTSSSTTTTTPITCGAGTTNVNGVCQLNTVITINSTLQTGLPATCFSFSPNPASVKANVAVQWQNNTSTTVTVINSNAVGLVTVNAGALSGGIVYASASNQSFGIQSCYAAIPQNAFYGVLTVTVN